MPEVTLKVTCTAGSYEIFVDGVQVSFDNNKNVDDHIAGRHVLDWNMAGNPGDTISITGSTAKKENFFEIKERKIPKKKNAATGAKFLEVPK